MNKIPGYETAQAYDGSAQRVTPGGHICRIENARTNLARNGAEIFELMIDIAEGGKEDGFYRKAYTQAKKDNENATWRGILGVFTMDRDGQCSPYFKGMMKSVEESNPGYTWNWDEASLRGKMIGVVFREEEYMSQQGELRTTVRPAFARSVARIKEGVSVPEIKRYKTKGGGTAAPEAYATEKFPWE